MCCFSFDKLAKVQFSVLLFQWVSPPARLMGDNYYSGDLRLDSNWKSKCLIEKPVQKDKQRERQIRPSATVNTVQPLQSLPLYTSVAAQAQCKLNIFLSSSAVWGYIGPMGIQTTFESTEVLSSPVPCLVWDPAMGLRSLSWSSGSERTCSFVVLVC